MISYKNWQLINESLYPLGLSPKHKTGGLVGQFQYLDEKKKHMDKDPEFGDDEDEDYEDEEDEDVDEDEDEEFSFKKKKSACGEDSESAFCKKMMKKKMKNECDCEDKKKRPLEMEDEDEDDDEEEFEDKGKSRKELPPEEDEGDEEFGEKKRPLGFMKKKGLKKKLKKESAEFLDTFNSYCSPKNQLTSEQEFWKSIKSHFSTHPGEKHSDGISEYLEDYLIAPEENTRQNNDNQEPAAGDPGFAPQQRIGWLGVPYPENNTI